MKKTIENILLCGVLILGVVGCKEKEGVDKKIEEEKPLELLDCLEGELSSIITSEKSTLVDIPLNKIKSKTDKILYYKGMYDSKQPDNMYVIVVEENKVFDADVMKDFNQYFYQKFSIYQEFEIVSEGITIYVHTPNNDVNFNDIKDRCTNYSVTKEKTMPLDAQNKITNAKKIIIKSGKKEIGVISNQFKLTKILNSFSSSKMYGDAFLCDGYGFEFELYDYKNELLDTIYVWHDGKRLVPKSLSEGCSYYFVNDIDLRKVIEENTNYIFYNILDTGDKCNKEELIYSDDKYNYYTCSQNDNIVLIDFSLTNQIMNLKYALSNNYISAEKIFLDYPSIINRQSK